MVLPRVAMKRGAPGERALEESSFRSTSRTFSRGEALPGELDLRVSAGQWLVSVSISDATGVVYLLRCFVLAEGGGPWFAGGRRGQGGGQMTAVGALGFQELFGAFGPVSFGGGERGDGGELGMVLLAECVAFAGGIVTDASSFGAGVGFSLAGPVGVGFAAAGSVRCGVAFAGLPRAPAAGRGGPR